MGKSRSAARQKAVLALLLYVTAAIHRTASTLSMLVMMIVMRDRRTIAVGKAMKYAAVLRRLRAHASISQGPQMFFERLQLFNPGGNLSNMFIQ